MEKIIISESGTDCSHVAYLYHTLGGEAKADNAVFHLTFAGDRVKLEISVDREHFLRMKKLVASSVADVIAISYKYAFFKKRLCLSFLSNADREVLLASLIAADFNDDKKYLVKKLMPSTEFSIDGFYNFRMNALKDKWEEIVCLIPEHFTSFELERFISFLLEGENKKIYIKDNEVFDERYRKLRRSRLIGSFPEFSFLREVILSGADNICCLTTPGRAECGFLKKYYGSRVFFN